MILLILAAMFIGGLVLLDEGGRKWTPQSVVGGLLVLTVAAIVVAAVFDLAKVWT
ncbi:hypothetical protein I5G63_gp064 [Mycobacterium phage Imvubu]|uniref:Uncharacterized protein n=1 Tax=Mycobacterium phage Imvubu TaxID=2686233 RepID=A0A6B9LFW0_9CAUD|nr:hypothetical protein I5G63_gp064 [Mycobacterium phage Imvubu]QHB37805.1 hypothetical protein PBI_IMVUBU_64 [Mycobacterium phage Imvubu]